MDIEILKNEPGRYALLKKGSRFYASVVCGTSIINSLNIPLTIEQIGELMDDEAMVDQLVGAVSFAPARFTAQHVDLN
jgi:hypothetical protein